MTEIKIPPNPRADTKCHKCKYWLKGERKNWIVNPNGLQQMQTPVHELPLQVMWMNGAPCTVHPAWQIVSKDHWCWQYEQTMASRVDEISKE